MTFDMRHPVVSISGGAAELCETVIPRLPLDRRELAARGQQVLGLPPLAIVDGDTAFTIDGGEVSSGIVAGALCLHIPPETLGDVVAERRTMLGLVVAGDVSVPPEHIDSATSWDHVLRALLYGIPVHERGMQPLTDAGGKPLDLARSFTPEDDDAEISAFLDVAGFAHLRGWVDPALMPSVGADVSDLAERSRPEDPHRWWAKLDGGQRVCVRIQDFAGASPAMARIISGEVYERVRKLSPDGHVLRPGVPAAVEALRKLPGVVEGLADFPWHRDCSTGGHAATCASIAVGLAVGAANAEAGQLVVLAGSHRASVPSTRAGRRDVDLPMVAIDTRPGDLTLHLSCTLHMTRPPKQGERSVVYTTFELPDRDASWAPDPAYLKAASMGR